MREWTQDATIIPCVRGIPERKGLGQGDPQHGGRWLANNGALVVPALHLPFIVFVFQALSSYPPDLYNRVAFQSWIINWPCHTKLIIMIKGTGTIILISGHLRPMAPPPLWTCTKGNLKHNVSKRIMCSNPYIESKDFCLCSHIT